MSDVTHEPIIAASAAAPGIFQPRGLIVAVLIAMFILGVIATTPLWHGRVSIDDDQGTFFLPIRQFYADCLTAGDEFDWMPGLFGGLYVTGEGQHGPYHPFHWLLYRWTAVDVAMNIELLLPYLLLPVGLVLFLRRYIDTLSACMGALLFTFSEQFVHTLINPQTAWIIAHTPWLLLAIHALIESPRASTKLLSCVAIGLMTASQFLLGYPQITWFSMFIEGFYAVFLLFNGRPAWFVWPALAGAKLLGIGLAAVQLLPSHSALEGSTRAAPSLAFKMSYSLPPSWLLGSISPYLQYGRFPDRGGTYFGAVAFMLAAWWVSTHGVRALRDLKRHDSATRLALATVATFVFAVWLALGVFGGLYYFQTLLPVIGKFRAPARYLIVAEFALAIVAAIGFSSLVSSAKRGEKVSWASLLPAGLLGCAALGTAGFFALTAHGSPAQRFQASFCTGPLMLGGAALGLILAARRWQIGFYGLIILAAVDMGLYGLGNPRVAKRCWHNTPTYEQYLASREGPPGPCAGRIYDSMVGMNLFAVTGYRLITGYAGLEPAQKLDYHHLNSLRVAEIAWFRDCDFNRPARTIPGAGPLQSGGWCAVPDPLPRVRLVDRAVETRDPRGDIKHIDIDTTALVERAIDLPRSEPGHARLLSDRPGRITIATQAPASQLLVLSESHHAGWQARLDDKPVDIEVVNGDFMGCVVPAGEHRISFQFAPSCLATGKRISLASLALATVLTGTGLLVRRRERRSMDRAERSAPAIRIHSEAASPAAVPRRRAERTIIICTPVFNDWESAILLLQRIDTVLQGESHVHASVLIVDDGSTESAPERLVNRLEHLADIEVLPLRCNVGHQRAIALGLSYIHAHRPVDAVVVMDADGEDSPGDIPRLLGEFESHDLRRVVFAQRARRSEGIVFRIGYQCYKLVHRMLTGRAVEVGNFSVLPAACLDRLVGVSELWNHYAASVFKARLPVAQVPLARGARLFGRSKMNVTSLIIHGLSAISVFADQVVTRLMIGSGAAFSAGLMLVATMIGAGLCGAAVSVWIILGLCAVVLTSMVAISLALTACLLILHARSHGSFLPYREYANFVGEVRSLVAPATVDLPRTGSLAA